MFVRRLSNLLNMQSRAIMNNSIFGRLLWKEYRLQRPLWISMAALTVAIMAILDCAVLNGRDLRMILWAAATLPALYCLGCGAMLFAGERESDVYEFLRSLPLGAGRLLAAKFAASFTGIVALFLLTLPPAFWICRHVPPEAIQPWCGYDRGLVLAIVVFGFGMFFWSAFFSLLTHRVLAAAVLGVAAASVHLELLSNVFGVCRGHFSTLPGLAAILLAVVAADCLLGLRWFREKTDRRAKKQRLPRRTTVESTVEALAQRAAETAAGVPAYHYPVSRTAMLGRLVWQHFRQSIGTLSAVAIGVLVLEVMVVRAFFVLMSDAACRFFGAEPSVLLSASVLVPLLGACTFLADQRRRGYRMLAHCATPPAYVWLSRQLVMLPPAAIVLGVLLLLAGIDSSMHWNGCNFVSDTAAVVESAMISFVVALAVGQACSMLFSSVVLACVFAAPISLVLIGWCRLMTFWNVPWAWSVLPIPATLYLFTLLRTRDWLVERNTFRAWRRPASVLIVAGVALLAAVPLFRVYQIPAVDPGFAPADYARPMTADEQTTLDLYEQAWQNFGCTGIVALPERPQRPLNKQVMNQQGVTMDKWIVMYRPAIDLALKAGRGKLFDPQCRMSFPEKLYWLACLTVNDALILEEQGRLDAALERYMAALRMAAHYREWCEARTDLDADSIEPGVYAQLPYWAARPKQTPERVAAALRELEKTEQLAKASDDGPAKLRYLLLKRFLDDAGNTAVASCVLDYEKKYGGSIITLWLHLPWERARALRLLKLSDALRPAGRLGRPAVAAKSRPFL